MFDQFTKEFPILVICAVLKQHKGEIWKFILSQFMIEFTIPAIIVIMKHPKIKSLYSQ